MKNARKVLEEFTALSLRDPNKAAAMFSEDGAFEMPCLQSLGFPWRYQGREQIADFFQFVRDLYPKLEFLDLRVVCETPTTAVAEYEFTTESSRTGRTIHQLFVGRYEVDNGQIVLLRESLNLVELGLALYPNGLAD